MDDIIVILVIILILAPAIWYIVKAKKNGVKCIGCSMSKTCSGHCENCNSDVNKNVDIYDELCDFGKDSDKDVDKNIFSDF